MAPWDTALAGEAGPATCPCCVRVAISHVAATLAPATMISASSATSGLRKRPLPPVRIGSVLRAGMVVFLNVAIRYQCVRVPRVHGFFGCSGILAQIAPADGWKKRGETRSTPAIAA